MKQRFINYLNYLDEICNKEITDEEKEIFLKGFLIQIDFYQCQNLLVPLTVSIISIFFSKIELIFIPNLVLTIFTIRILILLMFYVRHF